MSFYKRHPSKPGVGGAIKLGRLPQTAGVNRRVKMGHIAALSCAGAEVANAVVRATALTKARGFISGTPLVRCLHLCDAITGTLEDHFYFDMWKLKCNCEQNVLN